MTTTAAAPTGVGRFAPRPFIPTQRQRHADDYDEAYLDRRAEELVSAEADLPLYGPVQESPGIATSAGLLARCQQYLSAADLERVRAAFRYADDAHLGQFRKSGEPYITHPLAVASILAEWHLDATTICAGLMHDVLEDTGVAKIEIAERFGVEVAEIVDGVSKLDKLSFSSTEIAQNESFRKMLLAMSRDVRVIFVKLADRLHNMRTLGVMRPDKRRRIGRETMDIYVPIAHRLGLNNLFRELQELSFLNCFPRRYEILRHNVIANRGKRRQILERILRETRQALPKHGVIARVQGRDKTIYGIYNRMRDMHSSFSEALDIYGFRVIVRDKKDCYLALAALHEIYKPVHQRFKDFIAIPRANGYQSLHTTVIGPNGTPIEFQIRTEQMQRVNEMGILSRWLYHDGADSDELRNMVSAWLQNLLEIHRHSVDSTEFIENIKSDLFPDRVYVFTPRSRIVSLPPGSCAVDFAYQVHTDIGTRAVGCRVNGEPAALTDQLKNGDVVEIITAPDAHPDPAWLNAVRSGRARAEIRQYLRERDRGESLSLGRAFLEKAAAEADLDLTGVSDEVWAAALSEAHLPDRDTLCAEIGLGKVFAAVVVARLRVLTQRHLTHPDADARVITILGTEGVSVQLAPCCHPLPGDPIVGFARPGHGLTVHRAECEHTRRGRQVDPRRWLAVRWQEEAGQEARFTASVELTVSDERAALATVATELARDDSAIVGVNLDSERSAPGGQILRLAVRARDRAHLNHILRDLRRLSEVSAAVRCLAGPSERGAAQSAP